MSRLGIFKLGVGNLAGMVVIWGLLLFLSYALFLGSEENYLELKKELPLSFFQRSLGMWLILGEPLILVLLFLNVVLQLFERRNGFGKAMLYVFIWANIGALVSTIIGTAFFFAG